MAGVAGHCGCTMRGGQFSDMMPVAFPVPATGSGSGGAERGRGDGTLGRGLMAAIMCVAVLAGCAPGAYHDEGSGVVVFVLDSTVDPDFVEGRIAGMTAAEVTHGSLVGRVLYQYCGAQVHGVPVESFGGPISRSAYLGGLRRVLEYAEGHPADRVVVNISLSSERPEQEERDLIARLIGAGALVVAAAGNEDAESAVYPAAYPGVVAVANATVEGKTLQSNYGDWVDIAADGDISFIDYEFLPYERLRREMEAHGTSFAAPKVAGTAAWLMRRDGELSPRQAWEIVRSTARRIDSDLFAQGRLGAGVLDVVAAKSVVARGYRLVHYALPVAVGLMLVALTLYLTLRHGLVGVFLSLMTWLVIFPSSVLVVIHAVRYVEFVGQGSLWRGAAGVGVLCAAALLATYVQDWNVAKGAIALLVPYAAFVLLPLLDALPVTPLAGAVVAAGSAVMLAVSIEVWTLHRISLLASGRDASGGKLSVGELGRIHRHALDRRVQQAALLAMAYRPSPEAVDRLLGAEDLPAARRTALREVARRNPDMFQDWLWRFEELNERTRSLIADALLSAGDPHTVPMVESILAARSTPGLERLLERLRGGPRREAPGRSRDERRGGAAQGGAD